jgi:hypothetical protein
MELDRVYSAVNGIECNFLHHANIYIHIRPLRVGSHYIYVECL